MPASFRPHSYLVLMGRGKEPAKSTGNLRLEILVNNELQKYVNAEIRRKKSIVVARVLETVQLACPAASEEGAYVKFDGQHWWEMDDNSAREKIGTMFRDRLHGQYKSSTKSKMAKRRAQQHEMEKRSCSSISCSTDTRASLGLVSSSTTGAYKGGTSPIMDLQNDAISSVKAFAKIEELDAWRKSDSPANVNSKLLERLLSDDSHSPHQKLFLGVEEMVRDPISLSPVASPIDTYVGSKGASDRNSHPRADGVWFDIDSQNLLGVGASVGKTGGNLTARRTGHGTSKNQNKAQ